jgi:Domain of unknown function (DUF1877)
MACRAVLFAISDDEVTKLVAAHSDEEILEIVQEQIEARWEEEWLYELDKAWDAIHRCLVGGSLMISEDGSPFALCILAGAQLHSGDNYIVSLKRPHQVSAIAVAIKEVTREYLRERYFKINSNEYGPISDDDFEYVWEYFNGLADFYAKAAAAGRHVIFTVDQ